MTDTETTEDAVPLTPRQAMLETLGRDLNAQGWDQHSKLYKVLGAPGDEYLELVAELQEDLIHYLDAHIRETDNSNAVGVVLTAEIWMYPRGLIENMPPQARPSYLRMMPPASHEGRVDGRVIVFVGKDGETLEVVNRKGEDNVFEWSDTPTRLGPQEVVIPPLRHWLEMSPSDEESELPSLDLINAIVQKAGRECWSEAQLVAVILNQLPPEERARYAQFIRPDILAQLGGINAGESS